jgi:hypothetical protein
MRATCSRVLLLLTYTTGGLSAQEGNDCLKNLKWPGVGNWATYQSVLNEKPGIARYAVVGTENRNGTEMKWIEYKLVGAKSNDTTVFQMLVPSGPHELGQVEEIVMKYGGRKAMKMTGMMMKMVRGQMEKSSFLNNMCEGVALVGEQSVTVPAGTFKTYHFHNSKYNSDSWISPSVPFAMVKATGKNHDIALTATGTGATSSITETPQDLMGGASK